MKYRGDMQIAVILAVLLALVIAYLFGVGWQLRRIVERWHGRRWGGRFVAIAGAALFTASPYLSYKGLELRYVLARVPDPLHALWIEYRLERSWGIGLPGDNETGFVIYRLTGGSADWARRMGPRLVEGLGGSGVWQPTPVCDDQSGRWSGGSKLRNAAHRPDFRNYLSRYGFEVPVDRVRIDEANRVVRNPGAFYRYGRGGSITAIHPAQGKVYFAYAG